MGGSVTPPLTLDDCGNRDRYLSLHAENLRHCTGLGWHIWGGQRWQRDERGQALHMACDVAKSIEENELAEAEEALEGAHVGGDKEDVAHAKSWFEKLQRWVTKCRNVNTLEAMVKLSSVHPSTSIVAKDLDADPWLLNCENGTIDLRQGGLRPHLRGDLITRMASAPYDPKATCPGWEAFLAEVQPDEQVRAFLRRLAGYCLTGVIREHVLPLFVGVGANGKGTYIKLLSAAMGTYARSVPADLFTPGAERNLQHPTIKMCVMGVRFAPSQETQEGARLDVATVKNMTGGDEISARFMNKDFVEFWPTHKFVLATNARPIIVDTSDGIWRRLLPVLWGANFTGREDTELPDRLRSELPGILAWAIRGCMEWQAVGLAPPASVLEERDRYRAQSDPLGDFLRDMCRSGEGLRVAKAELYEVYASWMSGSGKDDRGQGLRPLGARHFGEELRRRGYKDLPTATVPFSEAFTEKRSSKVGKRDRGWAGLRVKTALELDAEGIGYALPPANPTPEQAREWRVAIHAHEERVKGVHAS